MDNKEIHRYVIPSDIPSAIPSVGNVHNWTELCFLNRV
jgi:hypothetical protein